MPPRATAIPDGLTEPAWKEYQAVARELARKQAAMMACYVSPTHQFPPMSVEVFRFHSGYWWQGKLQQKNTHCTVAQRCNLCGTIRESVRVFGTFAMTGPYKYFKPADYPTVRTIGVEDRWVLADAYGAQVLADLRRRERRGEFKPDGQENGGKVVRLAPASNT